MDDVEELRAVLLARIGGAADLKALEAARVGALGKKGELTQRMKELGRLAPEMRRAAGQRLNALKNELSAALEARRRALESAALESSLAQDWLDVTLPARPGPAGRLHPIGQVSEELIAIFGAMGFEVAEGPDIEDDFHNFAALNIPPEHPARQMHDTFYLGSGPPGAHAKLLRTHTSPVQIRAMRAGRPPFRIIAPGRTYRCDSDMTHTPMFHQIEGLLVDRAVHMGHLKGCLVDFARTFFEQDEVPVRFRPSFFPFTEPSAEMDVAYAREGGELKVGRGGGWLEILGCGMVHPKVLQNVGLDPAEWQGFAFGLGIERAAMLKYGIPDLRTFFEPDLRWLRHYGFDPLDVPSLTSGLSR